MYTDIQAAFDQFNQQQLLIIGDVMIDAYMWGKVERISPEAPVPVISVSKRENRLGGAANVALNVKALGARPVMCAVIGDDSKGKVFQNLLKKRALTAQGILVSNKRKTTVKTRVISNNQHLLRIDDELSEALSPDLEKEFIAHIDALFEQNNFDAIIFEDYDKGNITPAIIAHVVALSKKLAIPTLVDPKKRNFLDYKGVTLFKPNFKEICEGLKIEIPKGDFAALHQGAERLRNELNAKHIMVTLSELGIYISTEGSYFQMPAQVRDIADVSGAGDTVISVAACCLAAKLAPELIAKISNIAGGLVCENVGVVPVEKDLLLSEMQNLLKQ
ncbi:MAG: bifunctional heptose 7-phosphate kinase/heptose 1-phosphate adenyltransferase [Salinivirgaceae bacterium]